MTGSDPFDLALFQPDRGLWIAPIRHHSPACAWAVRAMIRELRPDHVLIEGPADLTPMLDLICDPLTRPPVAAVMLRDGRSVYAPFCDHSPEYVALQTARDIGAKPTFIDLPSDRFFDHPLPRTGPVSLTDETPFGESRFIDALSERTGCRDGFELWDHLFEARLGDGDWRSLLRDVGHYCAGLRQASGADQITRDGHAAREEAMQGHIAQALKTGTVVVVVGGFHAPALVDPKGTPPKTPPMQDAYLIRYSHAAMDALAGYGAGLPQPGFYDALWQAAERANGPPDWSGLGADLMQDFCEEAGENGHPVSLPAKVETLRMARTLAGLRGRKAMMRHDMFDGVTAALTKGEASARDPWAERLRRHWHGTALGDVPGHLNAPPLVEDARQRARAMRLNIDDSSERRRSLDIHRKPRHLATSRFLHAMRLLETGFARFEAGPDYVTNPGSGRLFEDWSYNWSPTVETRLIELCAQAQGDTIPAACLSHIWAERSDDITQQVELLSRAIRAGIGAELGPFVQALSQDIARSGSFADMGHVLQRIYTLCHTNGPMRAPAVLNLADVMQAGYRRLVYLADDLPQVPADMVGKAVAALRLAADLLASDDTGQLDRQLFDDAMLRLTRVKAPPEITGAALSLALRAGQLPAKRLVEALNGRFIGAALSVEDRIGVLTGLIATAPDLLWQVPEVLSAVDAFLLSLAEGDFLTLLPNLRRSLTALNPRETDRLADALSLRHGTRPDIRGVAHLSEADLVAGLAAEAALLEALRADGLLDEETGT